MTRNPRLMGLAKYYEGRACEMPARERNAYEILVRKSELSSRKPYTWMEG